MKPHSGVNGLGMAWILLQSELRFTPVEILGVVTAYLIGSFSTAYYFVRWKLGKDIRTLGSGNSGARNVRRVLGFPGFAITFLGDFSKGIFVVILARAAGLGSIATLAMVIAVIAGHNWPIQLGFRGGKGVATSLGALLMLDCQILGVIIVAFALAYALIRGFTTSGLLAYAICPIVLGVLRWPVIEVVGTGIVNGLVLIAHHADIRKALELFKRFPDRTVEKP